MTLLHVLKSYAPQFYVACVVSWIVFLVLLHLTAGLFTSTGSSSTAREESRPASEAQSGCLEIEGIEICD